MSQPQPINTVQIVEGPNVAKAVPLQKNAVSRLNPQLSTPTRPTLNPDKEIMKGGISFKYEEEEGDNDDDDESDEELSDKEVSKISHV